MTQVHRAEKSAKVPPNNNAMLGDEKGNSHLTLDDDYNAKRANVQHTLGDKIGLQDEEVQRHFTLERFVPQTLCSADTTSWRRKSIIQGLCYAAVKAYHEKNLPPYIGGKSR